MPWSVRYTIATDLLCILAQVQPPPAPSSSDNTTLLAWLVGVLTTAVIGFLWYVTRVAIPEMLRTARSDLIASHQDLLAEMKDARDSFFEQLDKQRQHDVQSTQMLLAEIKALHDLVRQVIPKHP